MKNKLKRLFHLMKIAIKGGPMAFFYLAENTLRSMRSEDVKYKTWIKSQECNNEEKPSFTNEALPSFSLLILGTDTTSSHSSYPTQTYKNVEFLDNCATITWKELLERTHGDYIGILCQGDSLSERALYTVASFICDTSDTIYSDCLENSNNTNILDNSNNANISDNLNNSNNSNNSDKLLFYSDEDCITENNKRCNPFFKPDYSPDTLRSFFYMGGFLVMKRELAEKLEFQMNLPIVFNGYLLALEASFLINAKQVCHIPEILYHRQIAYSTSDKASLQTKDVSSLYQDTKTNHTQDIQQLSKYKEQLFKQYGMDVRTEKVPDCDEVRIIYELREEPKVSIIIPSKDNPSMLRICMESIASNTAYDNYEIVVIDNGSNPDNKKAYELLCKEQKIPCIYFHQPMDFNFSKMCNMGVEHATGEYYLFLNDDMELTDTLTKSDWLERLIGQAMQPHTGAVGAKLLYPSTNRIQHVGCVNYEHRLSHILGKMSDDTPLGFGRNRLDYNYTAVTGACLFIDKNKFRQAGGFCEQLAVTFNDIDLGMKLTEAGYYNVVRNDVVMYHHESISRGMDVVDNEKFVRHLKEREKLFSFHPTFVKRDPFYSRHLTQMDLNCHINTELRPTSFKTFSDENRFTKASSKELPVTYRIEYARKEANNICIGGFAYSESIRYNNLNQTYILLKGTTETICLKTVKLYNHMLSSQLETKRNLSFAEFYTSIPTQSLNDKQYEVGIILHPFAKNRAQIVMTDTILTATRIP